MYLPVEDFVQSRKCRTKSVVDYAIERGCFPTFNIFYTKHDPALKAYMTSKAKLAKELGIDCRLVDCTDLSYAELTRKLAECPEHNIPGILQMPLRSDLQPYADILVDYLGKMDADGLAKDAECKPATALGVMEYMSTLPIKEGALVLVIGRSALVGKPLAKMLEQKNFTVALAHSKTPKVVLNRLMKQADVIVTAVGKPDFMIRPEDVKEGAIVIDVAFFKECGKAFGDCSKTFAEAKNKWATPVPGGVGRITTAYLMKNVMEIGFYFD